MSKHYGAHNTYISKLNEGHKTELSSFKSTNSDQNDFLANDALEYAKLSLGVTYLLYETSTDKLIAFITLGTGAIKLPENKEDWLHHGKKLKEYPKEFPRQFPALKIGQLATHATEEGRGAGTYLVQFALRTGFILQAQVGCAYLITDAYPEKVSWYEKRGFRVFHRGDHTTPMYFELPY